MTKNEQLADNPLGTVAPWDWVADSYIDIAMPFLAMFVEPALQKVSLRPSMRVIDVAAGPGTLSCQVAPRVSRVDAIDFSGEMVQKCNMRLRELGTANVTVQQGDGQALPFGDATFDAGFSMFGLMFFPDRLQGFRELLRVLKPGGTAVVTSWAPIDESPLMLARVAAQRVANPDSVPPQQNLMTLENREVFIEEMRRAGFVDVTVERVARDYVFRDFDQLYAGLTSGSAPFELLKRKLGEVEWSRQLVAMREYLARSYRTFPVSLGSTALLGCGRKAS